MASLSAKQEAFIKLMAENDELARRGFDLLLKRSDFDQFFDHLEEAGFFQAQRNPAPTPVDEKGFFRIPYWNALDYLVAVARLAGSRADVALGQKVIAVVRATTNWVDGAGIRRDNYHTYRKFAEILGLVPISALSDEDMQLIPIWLGSKFDRGSVGHTLADGLIPRLLASDSPADWGRVVTILSHCTAVTWVEAKELGQAGKKPTMPVEDYWLDELVTKYAHAIGQKAGQPAADLFLSRTREVFGADGPKSYSHVYRPAVEEHSQNHSWRGPENICVKGLRDALLGWCDQDANAVRQYVASLIASPDEIVRRIAISVIDQRWDALREVFVESLSPQLFEWGHLHELYTLLKTRFASLKESEQAKTLDAINHIPEPTWADDPVPALRRMRRQWLSAIAGKNYQPVDDSYAELNADKSIGGLSEHPDFDSYMEVSWGPGPSPYSTQELLGFASAGSLIDRLNDFQPSGPWNGPTMRALTDALEDAVRQASDVFVRLLPQFLSAKRPFQFAALNGLKNAWESNDTQAQLDWDAEWPRILDFFEKTIGDDAFWAEDVVRDADFSPTRDWIPPVVADFLRNGTKDDARAYPEALLPRALALIKILLKRAPAGDEPNDDAMTQAINSSKGKAVEALMSHALRTCRLADRAAGTHTTAWEELRPVYDAELAKCTDANFEFSTLCGAYLANLFYLSQPWVEGNIAKIFPAEHHANNRCALDGLAYSRAQSSVYALLVNAGVIDRALKADLKGRYTLEKLVERVAVAYVRGEESLDSPRFTCLFESGKERELELVARFLWSIRGEPLSAEQVGRVIDFWDRCVEWSAGRSKPPAQLLSALASLAGFLKSADGRNLELLSAVAPFVHIDHGAYQLFEELSRLVPTNPVGTAAVLGRFLAAHVPDFDYQDRLKSLLRLLAAHGQRQEAIKYTELARNVSGMQVLFDELTKGH